MLCHAAPNQQGPTTKGARPKADASHKSLALMCPPSRQTGCRNEGMKEGRREGMKSTVVGALGLLLVTTYDWVISRLPPSNNCHNLMRIQALVSSRTKFTSFENQVLSNVELEQMTAKTLHKGRKSHFKHLPIPRPFSAVFSAVKVTFWIGIQHNPDCIFIWFWEFCTLCCVLPPDGDHQWVVFIFSRENNENLLFIQKIPWFSARGIRSTIFAMVGSLWASPVKTIIFIRLPAN